LFNLLFNIFAERETSELSLFGEGTAGCTFGLMHPPFALFFLLGEKQGLLGEGTAGCTFGLMHPPFAFFFS
jgi:hypothetical protein